MKKILFTTLTIIWFSSIVFAQTEILTNKDIVLMTEAELSENLIIRKIKSSKGKYDVNTQALIKLKKAGVTEKVIDAILDAQNTENKDVTSDVKIDPQFSDSDTANLSDTNFFDSSTLKNQKVDVEKALKKAKTIALLKSSVHPARQALEKELLKRKDWKSLNLDIVKYKANADLYVQIGYVSLSWISHRYVYRIYERRSGVIVAAGETTSWGSLAKNLARGISKKLNKVLNKK